MSANQSNALLENPNQLPLTCVATYRRTIHANLARVWENVLDWEHLPHLHATSFDYVELDEVGGWGWRTWASPSHKSYIELCVDRENLQYVARTYRGEKQLSEIWTRLVPDDNDTEITVSFLQADVPDSDKDKVGDIYLKLYSQLWDEDEAMMIERQRQLDRARRPVSEVNLGPREALTLPMTVEVGRSVYHLIETDAGLMAHAAICPHNLGPLPACGPGEHTVTCPWHGYRFNVSSGECVSPDSASCKLSAAPDIHTGTGDVILKS